MDLADYDEDAYRAALLRKLRRSQLVVHHAAFAPASVSRDPVLLAVTSTGLVHVFELARVLRPEYWEEGSGADQSPTPSLSFEAHPTQIYTLAFAGDMQDPLVITGGDQDFRVWRWKDIAGALRDPAPRLIQPVHISHLDRQTMGYRGALLPYSEINAIATTTIDVNRVFLAGGDSIAHEFDLATQKCVHQFGGAHSDYLHAVQFVNHSHELVTGSEDGTVCLWDARAAKKIEVLTPQPKASATASAKSNVGSRWVKAVATDASETWLACGGGSSKSSTGAGGFLSMWHLPSRVPIHYTETQAADVHDLAYYHTDLLTVGNEPSLQKWNRSSGALLSSARTSVSSAQFCVVDKTSDLIVLGGYSSQLDVCMMPGVVSFSLTLDGE